MGTVTAIEEVDRIRRELAEYDLAHSRDPIDRRRFEKQVEQQAQKAREAEQNQQTENWKAYIEGRIRAWFEDYFGADEDGASGHYADAIGQVVEKSRQPSREERRSVDANL